MATNAQIITAVAQAVKDSNKAKRTAAIYAQILTDAQDWLVEATECLRKVDTSIVLVADTQEYSLPSTFIKFPTETQESDPCPVQIGTNGLYQLEMITLSKLEVKERGWRDTDAGTPKYCYIIREGTLKIGFHPKPSATFITDNGSSVYVDHIFRGTAIADDSASPFNSSTALQGLQQILKFRAQWQIWMEDLNFSAADRFDSEIFKEGGMLDHAKDLVQSVYATPGPVGFGASVRQD